MYSFVQLYKFCLFLNRGLQEVQGSKVDKMRDEDTQVDLCFTCGPLGKGEGGLFMRKVMIVRVGDTPLGDNRVMMDTRRIPCSNIPIIHILVEFEFGARDGRSTCFLGPINGD